MVDIPIGSGVILTDHDGYSKLINFYYKCCEQELGSEIMIDFEKLQWVDGNMAALIVGMLKKMEYERSFIFYVDPEDVSSRFNILVKNGLITGVEIIERDNMTALALTGFEINEDLRFVEYIQSQLLSHQSQKFDDKQKKKLMNALLELYTNVQKHARSKDPYFVCGQYFKNLKLLRFTLVDLGIGYLKPIQEFTRGEVDTSGKAIRWALKKGNTTRADSPGGLGLKDILDYCDESGAIFDIITGNTYWSTIHKPKKVREFCGTAVNLTFKCQ